LIKFERIWIQWLLVTIGAAIIIVLQIFLDGELYVQAGIVLVCFALLISYWGFFYSVHGHLPRYNWPNLTMAIGLFVLSTSMFSIQNITPNVYWAAHSIWHSAAGIGSDYWIRAKEPPPRGSLVDLKIY
jgi:membrane associated rhomboid family serine protease